MTTIPAEESIVDLLDDRAAPPAAALKIAHDLLLKVNSEVDLVKEVIMQYESGFVNEDHVRDIRQRVFNKLDMSEENNDENLYRLALSLLTTREYLDGYGAEYFFYWSKGVGLNDKQVVGVFSKVLRQFGYDI